MSSNSQLPLLAAGAAAGAALVFLGVQVGRSGRVRDLLETNARLQQQLEDRERFEDDRYLTSTERAAIRRVFDRFADANGRVKVSDLRALNNSLGEPMPDDQLEQVSAERGADASLTYEDFVRWWHSDGARESRLRPRFHLMMHKLDAATLDEGMIFTRPIGEKGTLEYRIAFYFRDASGAERQISPWHDVPLYASRGPQPTFNLICEIPKWTRCKYEIEKGEDFNAIRQDTKNGCLRSYKHGDMIANYGAFSQTWEDPTHINADTQAIGDNDPLDALEIGTRQLQTGEICPVKVLGVLAMIDDGETDWKLITISVNDPLAEKLNDIEDVETVIPGLLSAVREWLRVYKVCVGGPPNTFGLGERFMNRAYAISVIEETHESWKQLVATGATTA